MWSAPQARIFWEMERFLSVFPLKTIISTATKTLQDQLYYQDLPIVREALGVSIESGLLKGRQNYLCLLRLERAQENLGLNTQHHVLLDRLTRWSSSTVSGDLEEIHEFETVITSSPGPIL